MNNHRVKKERKLWLNNLSVSKVEHFLVAMKIFINSGKCVLHTSKEEERRKMKKDRSFSGPFGHSPNAGRKLNKNDTLRSSHMSSSRYDLAVK